MTKFPKSGRIPGMHEIGDRKGTGFIVDTDVMNLPNTGKNEGYLTFGSHQEGD